MLALSLVVLCVVGAGWWHQRAGTPWFVLGGAVLVGVQWWLMRFLGDAARYLSPRPQNIALRQARQQFRYGIPR